MEPWNREDGEVTARTSEPATTHHSPAVAAQRAGQETFVRGNARLHELLARPDIAAGVTEVEHDIDRLNKIASASVASHDRRAESTEERP